MAAASSCRRPAVLALIWLAWVGAPGESSRTVAAEDGSRYLLGVFPYLPALTIDRIFGPMAASFATALDHPVHLKTKSTFERFARELRRGTYDIIFVHPFLYVNAADRHDYRPLARLDGQLTAVVLVPNDRPWRAWADLAGKTLAVPPTLSAVSELAKLNLLEVGLRPGIDTKIQHHRTKMSCLRAVAAGTADACVLPRFVLPQIPEIGDGKLRVMAETRAINNVVFAAHPRLPEAEKIKLRSLIISWPHTEPGRAILAVGSWPRFVAARDSDYDEVRDYSSRLAKLAQR